MCPALQLSLTSGGVEKLPPRLFHGTKDDDKIEKSSLFEVVAFRIAVLNIYLPKRW